VSTGGHYWRVEVREDGKREAVVGRLTEKPWGGIPVLVREVVWGRIPRLFREYSLSRDEGRIEGWRDGRIMQCRKSCAVTRQFLPCLSEVLPQCDVRSTHVRPMARLLGMWGMRK